MPVHTEVEDGATVTEGTNVGLTIIVIVPDNIFIGLAQLAELVNLTLTTSPLTNELELKVLPVNPD